MSNKDITVVSCIKYAVVFPQGKIFNVVYSSERIISGCKGNIVVRSPSLLLFFGEAEVGIKRNARKL